MKEGMKEWKEPRPLGRLLAGGGGGDGNRKQSRAKPDLTGGVEAPH